ncbi:hypothetical protein BH23ACT6_BH23ACT6_28140 [soil metagenome]
MDEAAHFAVVRGSGVGLMALALVCAIGWTAGPTFVAVCCLLVAAAVTALTMSAWRHDRLARTLRAHSQPGEIHGIPVQWFPLSHHVGVAGLRRPAIFCDPTLADRLSNDELHAVLLHERCHQQHRDPLQLVGLNAAVPLLRVFAAGRRWLEHRRSHLEIRADRYALEHGASRSMLARALLKLDDSGASLAPTTAGFALATNLRLAALLESDPIPSRGNRQRARAVTAACALTVWAGGILAYSAVELTSIACALALPGC